MTGSTVEHQHRSEDATRHRPDHGFPTEWCIAEELPCPTEPAPADEAPQP